ncbi:MAG: DegT/DnrJ/EryC1/StrS family aminotransferase [Chloroflexi bacterium]|nr:MAG: DegT/DnrJ/EryC1/StrS family aminotransferase [Chloroflexota bacterium]
MAHRTGSPTAYALSVLMRVDEMDDALAIRGGTAAVPHDLKRRWPDIRPEDKAAVLAVLDRGELTGINGVEATSLEREWADRLGVAHAVLFNTGTAAIHAALYAVGVQAGDEVITTAFTFSGTFQAILHQGAIPVFVDIDPSSYNIDPTLIEARITPRTKAILPVHIHGLPCDMDAIMAIAQRHSLTVVEDAAQAHLATYKGRYAGTIGQAGAFSIQATKNLSGVEGGFVVSDDHEVAAAARRIRTYGEDIADGSDLGGWYFRPYTVFSVGWNYRSNELSAAFARSQLRRLDEYTAIAQRNGRFLNKALAAIPGLAPPVEPRDVRCRRAGRRVPRSPHGGVTGRRRGCGALAHPARDLISDPPDPCRLRARVPMEPGPRRGPGRSRSVSTCNPLARLVDHHL